MTTSTTVRHGGRALAAALAALLIVALNGSPGRAAGESVTWSVKPAENSYGAGRPNFAYAAEPGGRIDDAVVVTNYAAAPLTLQLYAADGFTTADGLLDLQPTGAPSVDVGTWVTLERTSLTLAPGQAATVPFTIDVPADARPGDHPGGIVTSLATTQEGSTLTVDRRLASRINLRVAGELLAAASVSDVRIDYDQALNPVAPSSAAVTYRVTNTGSVRIFATEQVTVSGPFGALPVSAPDAELPEVLPGSSLERTVVVPGVWPLGLLQAEVELQPVGIGLSGSVPAVHDQASTAAVPWAWLGLLALLVLAAYLVARRGAAAPAATTTDPESAAIASGGRS